MSDNPALFWRSVLIVLALHSALVATASYVKHFFWEAPDWARRADQLVRYVDFAVLWATDSVLRSITDLPSYWPFGIRWTAAILETVVHSAIGGLFWVLIATALARLIKPRRAKEVAAP